MESMLPRESNSKETDAAVFSVIGFPAFAVNNAETIGATLATVREKLGGVHYEPWELRVFDGIECEWPLFLCYIGINHLFCGEQSMRRTASCCSTPCPRPAPASSCCPSCTWCRRRRWWRSRRNPAPWTGCPLAECHSSGLSCYWLWPVATDCGQAMAEEPPGPSRD